MNWLIRFGKIYLVDFGFCSWKSLFCSCFRPDHPEVAIGALSAGFTLHFIDAQSECWLGLDSVAAFSFGLMMVLEFATGIFASVFVEHRKFSARKMKRSGAMMVVWLILLFIVWNLHSHIHREIVSTTFGIVFDGLLIYIPTIYIVSIRENIKKIKSYHFRDLITMFTKKEEDETKG